MKDFKSTIVGKPLSIYATDEEVRKNYTELFLAAVDDTLNHIKNLDITEAEFISTEIKVELNLAIRSQKHKLYGRC